MQLKQYFHELTLSERQGFIDGLVGLLNKKEPTIRSYINGHRAVQPQDAKVVSKETGGKVTITELCPLVFGDSAQ